MRNQKLIIAAILTVFSFGCHKTATKDPAPKPVKVKEVEIYTPQKGSRYSASIRPNTQVEVSFKVGGYIETIGITGDAVGQKRTLQAGDLVGRGQFLAQLRRDDYRTKVDQAVSQKGEVIKGVNSSLAQIAEIESAVSVNRSQLTEAEAGLDQAKTDFERTQNLYQVQSLTKKDFDTARTNLDMARARVESARASLKATEAKVKTARTQAELNQAKVQTADSIVEQMKIPLQDTTLRAPFTGVILERRVEAGELASPGVPAFILADTVSVKAVFGVPDLELKTLKNGQTLVLTTDALPNQEFSGHVSRISPMADQSSRVFEVEVTIPNLQNLLKPGMIASLELMSERTTEAGSVVPLGAVVRSKNDPNGYAVFVVEEADGNQLARLRDVVLGETFGNSVAVTKGVQTGDRVIISGATFVNDGEKVQIIP